MTGEKLVGSGSVTHTTVGLEGKNIVELCDGNVIDRVVREDTPWVVINQPSRVEHGRAPAALFLGLEGLKNQKFIEEYAIGKEDNGYVDAIMENRSFVDMVRSDQVLNDEHEAVDHVAAVAGGKH